MAKYKKWQILRIWQIFKSKIVVFLSTDLGSRAPPCLRPSSTHNQFRNCIPNTVRPFWATSPPPSIPRTLHPGNCPCSLPCRRNADPDIQSALSCSRTACRSLPAAIRIPPEAAAPSACEEHFFSARLAAALEVLLVLIVHRLFFGLLRSGSSFLPR